MWTVETIKRLVADRASESLTLEYKANLPDRSDRGKSEFLKDVCALANASGGTILYGVSETNGSASAVNALQLTDVDAEILRLSQMAEAGLEPRLSGISFQRVALQAGDVLVVTVPESLDGPHRYLFNGHSKFVRRVGSMVSELNYDQIRAAFDRSATRIGIIRSDWKDDLNSRRSWKPIIPGPMCMIRLSPLVSADKRQIVDPKVAHHNYASLIMSDWGGGSASFNYEGLAVYHGRGAEALASFVQVHRDGRITSFRTARLTIDDRKIIPSTTVGNFTLKA